MQLRPLWTMVIVSLVLTGCGRGEEDVTAPDVTARPLETPSAMADETPTDASSTMPAAEDTPTSAPTDTSSALPDDELAGDPYDGPPVGGRSAELDVVGVEAGDVLNVRRGPGTDQPVVATLDPLAIDVAATGRGRALPESLWVEVEIDGVLGWLSAAFVGYLGDTTDITSVIVDEADGRPRAETLEELAAAVAAYRASEEPPSRIVIVDGPDVGDLGEVTVDVIGLGDDALLGERLVVFATDEGDGWEVTSVEATAVCTRGEWDGGCP